MSQAGPIDFIGSHPEIPTQFDTDNGNAVPIGNVIEILGTTVANHNIPLRTTGSGNTVTVEAQYATAVASTDATKAGFASFNSAQFTVDANGFVSISGSAAAGSFNVDTATPPGTDPVVPNGSGVVTVTGGQVAAGTTANVIQTNSLAANTYTIQIQRASAQASSTIGANGVAHFDSTDFSVDANGFVTLGATGALQTLTGNVGTATPSGGNIQIKTANSTVIFNASGAIITQDFGLNNLLIGSDGASISTAINTVSVGYQAGNALTIGSSNSFFGFQAGINVTSGGSNCYFGSSCGASNINSGGNIGIGVATLTSAIGSAGDGVNTAVGNGSLPSLTTGVRNTCLGFSSGLHYTSSESSNILLRNDGVLGESNVIRIGDPGSALGQQNKCFIAGIDGVNVGSVATVVTEASNQLGTAVITAGTGISVTPGPNTITIAVSGSSVGETITGNTGGALSPTAGNWNILGGSGVTTSGSGSTLTISAINYTSSGGGTMAINNGYFATGAGTFNLPSTSSSGSKIEIICDASGVIVKAATGVFIKIGSSSSTSAGSATSNAVGDALTLIYRNSTTTWEALSSMGTWTLA